ncbi:MAG: dihydroorotate dehydrogenase [Nanoarchaeota archaeon]|nr:dihydroorotate dehydrogenase [Nanoarchaeota archaeon]MBU1005438.1 dihydroorotate dehydrogenase [Nanoarchaeota archaeon]MBU1945447.1 dihydroorotate dehydrogenase [Nanoarchaeota archaeon]
MINTTFCKIELQSPLVLASGILGTSVDIMNRVAENGAGAVTTKSIGPIERQGHNNPSVIEIENGLYNAVGLPTPGYLNMGDELKRWKEIKVPLIASVYGSSIRDYVHIVEYLQKYKPSIIELNISCPNKDDGMMFGASPRLTSQLVRAVKAVSSIPIMPKLTPNCDNIGRIAKECEKSGADAICAINTVQKTIIHPELKVPLLAYGKGGISGPIIREIALEKVKEIREAVKIPILGLGGITTGEDAIEMLKAGATLVGIGSGVYSRGIDIFKKVNEEIKQIMKKEGYKTLGEIK